MSTVRAVIILSVASALLLASCAPTATDVCPDVVDTDVTYPDIVDPDIADPDIVHPDIVDPDVVDLDIIQPDIVQPDFVHTEIVRPDVVRPSAVLSVPSVAVVADVVIAREEVASDNYYVLDESRRASSWMLEGATKTLEARRYRVVYTVAPFVGGFLGDGELADVATEIGRTPWPWSSPFFVSPAVDSDTAYSDALLAVVRRVASIDVWGTGPVGTHADSTVPAAPDWSLLSERLGADYLLVAVAEGVSVSGGREMSSACFSSCFSMAFSMLISAICSSVTGANVEPDFEECAEMDIQTLSTLRSTVQMFDTRTGKVVWTRTKAHSHINPLSQSFYVTEWAPSLLQDIRHSPRGGR